MALSGLLGLALLFYWDINYFGDYSKRVAAGNNQIELLKIDVEHYKKKNKDIDQKYHMLFNYFIDKYPIETTQAFNKTKKDSISSYIVLFELALRHPELMPQYNKIEALYTEFVNNYTEFERAFAKYGKENAELLKFDKGSNLHMLLVTIGMLLMAGLSTTGFSLWYYKVQIYQDRILEGTIKNKKDNKKLPATKGGKSTPTKKGKAVPSD